MKIFSRSYILAGVCVLIAAVAVFYAPINFWIQILNFSEKMMFQKAISYNRLDLPESWFELRQDDFDASIPEAVIEDFQTTFKSIECGGW
jgi:hypothetical protein